MNFVLFLPHYIRWHYSLGLKDLFVNFKSLLSFVLYFFSIGSLAKTLFAPWKRMSEDYVKGFDPEAFFSTLIVNLILRFVGFVIRSAVIIIGVVSFLFSLVLAAIIFFFWIFFPFVLVFILAIGIKYFFNS